MNQQRQFLAIFFLILILQGGNSFELSSFVKQASSTLKNMNSKNLDISLGCTLSLTKFATNLVNGLNGLFSDFTIEKYDAFIDKLTNSIGDLDVKCKGQGIEIIEAILDILADDQQKKCAGDWFTVFSAANQLIQDLNEGASIVQIMAQIKKMTQLTQLAVADCTQTQNALTDFDVNQIEKCGLSFMKIYPEIQEMSAVNILTLPGQLYELQNECSFIWKNFGKFVTKNRKMKKTRRSAKKY